LFIDDGDDITVGNPTIDGAKVVATCLAERKGDKVVVFKYKPKVRYQRKTGHRQLYTRLEIKEILRPGEKPSEKVKAKPKAKPKAEAKAEEKPSRPRRKKAATGGKD